LVLLLIQAAHDVQVVTGREVHICHLDSRPFAGPSPSHPIFRGDAGHGQHP